MAEPKRKITPISFLKKITQQQNLANQAVKKKAAIKRLYQYTLKYYRSKTEQPIRNIISKGNCYKS